MNITLIGGLPFVSVDLVYRGRQLTIGNILLDTGSGGTVFQVDTVRSINLSPEPDDTIHCIRGVGGVEYVFEKKIDLLRVGDRSVKDFPIELGRFDYGHHINGILGADFLIETDAIIDFGARRLDFPVRSRTKP